MLGHHAANFGGFRHCGSGAKMFLICYVISKDYLFKAMSYFLGGSLLQ